MTDRHFSTRALAGAAILGFGLTGAMPAAAAPDQLDPTFDGDGRVTTDVTGAYDEAQGVALQPDGKLVAAGGASGTDVALTRYEADGSLDPGFGDGGRVVTDVAGGEFDQAYDVVVQPDGRILAVGMTVAPVSGFTLVRYEPDGSLDTTFGDGGIVASGFAEAALAVALQPDGKIVTAGNSGPGGDFELARFTPDGAFDPTFGTGGTVSTDFGGADSAQGMVVQPDGRIVAAGQVGPDAGCCAGGLARYDADGSLDTSFGDGGLVVPLPSAQNLAAVALQDDGRIVAAGRTGDPDAGDLLVARLTADGSPDPSFGGDGIVVTDLGGPADDGRAVAIDAEGGIVVGGTDANPVDARGDDFAVVRYRPDGSLDGDFGTGGIVLTDFAGLRDQVWDLLLDGEGRIVAAGHATVAEDFSSDFGLARYSEGGVACTITGTEGDDRLRGGRGDDVLCGLGGDDRLSGGRGDDTVIGSAGADRLDGGPGRDTLDGVDGVRSNDRLDGGPGRDSCSADRGDRIRNCG